MIRWRRIGNHARTGRGWAEGLLGLIKAMGYRRVWRISDILGDGREAMKGTGWWEAEFEVSR